MLLWLALLSLWPVAAQNQSPGAIDSTFNAGAIDGAVRCVVVQSDFKIVAIGDFNQIGGANRLHVARLNSNGSVDDSFVPAPELWFSPSNRVTHLAVQRNRSVLLGGRFELQYPELRRIPRRMWSG